MRIVVATLLGAAAFGVLYSWLNAFLLEGQRGEPALAVGALAVVVLVLGYLARELS